MGSVTKKEKIGRTGVDNSTAKKRAHVFGEARRESKEAFFEELIDRLLWEEPPVEKYKKNALRRTLFVTIKKRIKSKYTTDKTDMQNKAVK